MEADAAQAQMTDEVGRDLVTIRRQAERISRVTRSILTFSRGTVSTLKPLDLNCVARTCVAMAGERVAGRSVDEPNWHGIIPGHGRSRPTRNGAAESHQQCHRCGDGTCRAGARYAAHDTDDP